MVPVLWISGAPGVGKSTAGWGLYRRLRGAGVPVAYVDVDQLGLFAPSPSDDPERRRLQAANAMAVFANFARHGAAQIVISGVVDPEHGLDRRLRESPKFDVTLVRLRAEWEELRRRYLGRGFGVDRLDELAALAGALDRGDAGVAVDVTAKSPAEVLDALVGLIGRAGGGRSAAASVASASADLAPAVLPAVPVLVLTGPTAVGKSTVGWTVFTTVCSRGITAAYIDADQLAFSSSGEARRLRADNLLATLAGHCRAGAKFLVVVARDRPSAFADELAGALVTDVHLDAGADDLAARVARRAGGEGPRLAGDSLFATPVARQRKLADRAAGEAVAFRRSATSSGLILDTSGLDATAVTRRVLELAEPSFPSR